MQAVRRVAFIPAPSVQMVQPKSRADLQREAEEQRQKAGVNTAPVVTSAEQLNREKAAKGKAAKGKGAPASKPATAPKASPAPATKSVEPPKPKIYLTRSVLRGLILAGVEDRSIPVIDASIRLAFLDGIAPKGAVLADVLVEVFYGKANPIRPKWAPIPADVKAIFGGGILAPKVARTTHNPLAESLRAAIAAGEITESEARARLLATTKDVKVVNGDKTVLVSRSAMLAEVSFQLPTGLVSARLAPEEKGEGKTISVSFTMLRRGTSDNDKAMAMLRAAFREYLGSISRSPRATSNYVALAIQRLGWSPESAYATWEATGVLPDGLTIADKDVEVTADKSGTPGKLLAWAVGFLNENADCSRVTFNEGTVLTVFFNDPNTNDPKVRAVLGPGYKRMTGDGELIAEDGIAIRRFWVGDGEDGSADLRAGAKGRTLMAEGLQVGRKVYPEGTDLTAASWAKPLKPGQYTKVGTVTDPETGVEYPALFLMQKITGYKVDNVLRHEAIRAEGRGNALPTVESTISANGKNGGAVLDKKSYEQKGFSGWMSAGKTDRCHFSRG